MVRDLYLVSIASQYLHHYEALIMVTSVTDLTIRCIYGRRVFRRKDLSMVLSSEV
jgi:hypothetical protein